MRFKFEIENIWSLFTATGGGAERHKSSCHAPAAAGAAAARRQAAHSVPQKPSSAAAAADGRAVACKHAEDCVQNAASVAAAVAAGVAVGHGHTGDSLSHGLSYAAVAAAGNGGAAAGQKCGHCVPRVQAASGKGYSHNAAVAVVTGPKGTTPGCKRQLADGKQFGAAAAAPAAVCISR